MCFSPLPVVWLPVRPPEQVILWPLVPHIPCLGGPQPNKAMGVCAPSARTSCFPFRIGWAQTLGPTAAAKRRGSRKNKRTPTTDNKAPGLRLALLWLGCSGVQHVSHLLRPTKDAENTCAQLGCEEGYGLSAKALGYDMRRPEMSGPETGKRKRVTRKAD